MTLLAKKRSLILRENKKPNLIKVPNGFSIFSYNQTNGVILKVCKVRTPFFDMNKLHQHPDCLYMPAKDHEDAKKSFDKFFEFQNNKLNEKEKVEN